MNIGRSNVIGAAVVDVGLIGKKQEDAPDAAPTKNF